ncbi:MAG: DUF4403 family protein [Bacteroidetes bacterium]|nr:DUF4403 family protein [Bacteroidota bacterium]
MRTFSTLILAALFLQLVLSCGSSSVIKTLKPEADLTAPIHYNKEVSQLNIPISIKIKDIEQQVNKAINGLVYEDTNLEDDNVILKIWKDSPIQLLEEQGKVKIVLPLKVWTTVRYGTNVLGMNLYDTRELNFNGTITLISDVTINNWQIQTKTAIKSIDWKESPSVTIAGKVVPITFLVNPALKYFRSSIEKNIDEGIKKSVSIKPYVVDALEKISQPLLISEQYQTWFSINPVGLNIAEIKLRKDALTFDLGLDCYMETYIGKEMTKSFQKEALVLKQTHKLNNNVKASLMVVSPYLQASTLITQNFKDQVFTSGNKKVMVNKVDLWHKNNKMVIALELLGSINGTVYLTGIPTYRKETQEIYFEELEYVLDSKNALLKTANWLAQGYILNSIKQHARYSIKSELEEANKQLNYYTNNYSPAAGIVIAGNLIGIEIGNIQFTNQALVVSLTSVGKINVTIDGLK